MPVSANDYRAIYVTCCDINGILRGKRIPVNHLDKALNGEIRLPLSVLNVDIWGADVIDAALADGDIDGLAIPTGRGLIPLAHTNIPSATLPVWITEDDGTPYLGDPRRLLKQLAEQLKAKGLTPVIATELEFYLVDDHGNGTPRPPTGNMSGERLDKTSILGIRDLYQFDAFLDDIYTACAKVDIPADTATAENGCGQFEINLVHRDDPLKAADDAILFKQIVKSVATKHGLCATFMAKPYGDQSGSGLHVHCSLLDNDGNNVFDNGTEQGSEMLLQAIAGVIDTMRDFTLIFAPNLNSYRRLAPGTHAPTSIVWGYENRTAAVRVPGGNPQARRLEHRVSGGDANPYLVIAAILAGILHGLNQQLTPPAPINGNTYDRENLTLLPETWLHAIDLFANSEKVKSLFPSTMIELIVAIKRQEAARFAREVTSFEYASYLRDL